MPGETFLTLFQQVLSFSPRFLLCERKAQESSDRFTWHRFDPFVLSHFKSFCFVDQGMFHLTDLHKRHARGGRYLVLSGDDRTDTGRDLMIRGGRLLEDSWSMFGVDLSFYLMPNTGHEFQKRQMTLVGRWLRGEPFEEMERNGARHRFADLLI